MPFWSSKTLETKLPTLIDPFEARAIDCNAYTLHMGNEVYVSPEADSAAINKKTKQKLEKGEAFTIPPGQFAFLLTSEIVTVPIDAMAFISIKAKMKFKGLVNISGFHVDPGWKGRLVFSVFNAGPSVIHIEEGQKLFLIWYAQLDGDSDHKKESAQTGIPVDIIENVSGKLTSIQTLEKTIESEIEKLTTRMNKVENSQIEWLTTIKVATGVCIGLLVGLAAYIFRNAISP